MVKFLSTTVTALALAEVHSKLQLGEAGSYYDSPAAQEKAAAQENSRTTDANRPLRVAVFQLFAGDNYRGTIVNKFRNTGDAKSAVDPDDYKLPANTLWTEVVAEDVPALEKRLPTPYNTAQVVFGDGFDWQPYDLFVLPGFKNAFNAESVWELANKAGGPPSWFARLRKVMSEVLAAPKKRIYAVSWGHEFIASQLFNAVNLRLRNQRFGAWQTYVSDDRPLLRTSPEHVWQSFDTWNGIHSDSFRDAVGVPQGVPWGTAGAICFSGSRGNFVRMPAPPPKTCRSRRTLLFVREVARASRKSLPSTDVIRSPTSDSGFSPKRGKNWGMKRNLDTFVITDAEDHGKLYSQQSYLDLGNGVEEAEKFLYEKNETWTENYVTLPKSKHPGWSFEDVKVEMDRDYKASLKVVSDFMQGRNNLKTTAQVFPHPSSTDVDELDEDGEPVGEEGEGEEGEAEPLDAANATAPVTTAGNATAENATAPVTTPGPKEDAATKMPAYLWVVICLGIAVVIILAIVIPLVVIAKNKAAAASKAEAASGIPEPVSGVVPDDTVPEEGYGVSAYEAAHEETDDAAQEEKPILARSTPDDV